MDAVQRSPTLTGRQRQDIASALRTLGKLTNRPLRPPVQCAVGSPPAGYRETGTPRAVSGAVGECAIAGLQGARHCRRGAAQTRRLLARIRCMGGIGCSAASATPARGHHALCPPLHPPRHRSRPGDAGGLRRLRHLSRRVLVTDKASRGAARSSARLESRGRGELSCLALDQVCRRRPPAALLKTVVRLPGVPKGRRRQHGQGGDASYQLVRTQANPTHQRQGPRNTSSRAGVGRCGQRPGCLVAQIYRRPRRG